MTAGHAVLILVHGTGDMTAELPSDVDPLGADAPAPLKWWQEGSEFAVWLRSRLATGDGAPLSSDGFFEFRWSGRNSEKAREEAAKKLAAISGELAESGRQLHYLAHSHGGNVVRRALELGVRSNRSFIGNVRSVTAFGTPFFHYTMSALLTPFVLSGIVSTLLLLLIALLYRRLEQTPSVDVKPVLLFTGLLLGGMALSTLFAFLRNAARLARHRRGSLGRVGDRVDFVNFLTRRDEAISLLMSFNDTIVLMRRRVIGDEFHSSPLGCGIQLSTLVSFVAVTLGIWTDSGGTAEELLRSSSSLDAWAIRGLISLVVGALAALFIAGVLTLSIVLPLSLAAAVMDRMITARLKGIAFGADAGNGISSVSTCPWPGFDHVARHVPEALEEEIENHIASNTSGLWGRVRTGLAPGVPLIEQDISSVVAEALSWDELSHTVYYRVESFAELIARRLHETGDWTYLGRPLSREVGSLP